MTATDWSGARVVVTGGASGIGLALARRAASLGAIVCILDIDGARAAEAAATIGGSARGRACDVGQADAMVALAAEIAAEFGGVDMVFANAGVGLGGKLERVLPADAEWVTSVNYFGIVNAVRAFVPLLRDAAKQARDARFVITGSEHSLGIPTIGASNVYTASKHAALGLADVLRSDLQGSGVKVSLLCPGLVATNIYDAKATRADRFGGAAHLPPEHYAQARAFVSSKGQDPALTAELCFEGLDRDGFLIITDPDVGVFARRRIAEIEAALVIVEQRLPSAGA